MSSAQTLCLSGLPGSGKHRVKKALLAQKTFEANSVLVDSELSEDAQVEQLWCVIDIRSTLNGVQDKTVEPFLQALIKKSSGVVFNFSEAADLESQSFWSRWVRQQCADMPIVRVLNQQFPKDWSGFDCHKLNRPAQFTKADFLLKPIETYEFDVDSVSLDHLLMGLDNSKQNLGMQIWRVQALLTTFEYENLVAIEGTPNRWDTYAGEPAPAQKSGWIKIQGFNLEQAWLNELIQASLLRA